VTSSDSGSLVIDILASGGATETPRLTRVVWSVLEGAVAAVLLLVGGTASLTALQTASIGPALPFSIIMVMACVSLLRAFHFEVATAPRYMRARIASAGAGAGAGVAEGAPLGDEQRGAEPRGAEPLGAEPPAGERRAAVPRGTEPHGRREVSATFAGLELGEPEPPTPAEGGEFIVAMHEVPTAAVDLDAEGVATLDEARVAQDPIAGEVFDTPEFAASQAGAELAAAAEEPP